jgi:hypothetical protein
MTRIDIKMMQSTELRELRTMIREELDFRAEVGKEIHSVIFLDRRNEQQAGIRNYVEGSFEHMVNNEI